MTIADVGTVFAMGATPEGSSPWLQFVPFAFVLAIFYFIYISRRYAGKVSVQRDTQGFY